MDACVALFVKGPLQVNACNAWDLVGNGGAASAKLAPHVIADTIKQAATRMGSSVSATA
jgi:hypothetical protein